MAICLEQSANYLHMVQLMPMLPYHLLLDENPKWFNLSHAGSPKLSWKKVVKLVSLLIELFLSFRFCDFLFQNFFDFYY